MTPRYPSCRPATDDLCHPVVSRPARTSRAFTLLEILSAITIICVLAALLVPAVSKMQSLGYRADSIRSLRAIGQAMQSYSNEHDGNLPGPLYFTQSPMYKHNSSGTLPFYLWSYLGDPQPNYTMQKSRAVANRAHSSLRLPDDSPVYIVQRSVRLPGNSGVPPFGYPTDPVNNTPLRQVNIVSYGLEKTWAVQEVDAQHPSVASFDKSNMAPKPVSGNVRMTLYFDWHVGAEPVNAQ